MKQTIISTNFPLFLMLFFRKCLSFLPQQSQSLWKRNPMFLLQAATLMKETPSQKFDMMVEDDGLDEESLKIFHGDNIPFSKLPLNPDLVQNLQDAGFTVSTQIQANCIPKIQSGEDVVIGAETGSGKTLAYLIPVFNQILNEEVEMEKKGISLTAPLDNDWSHIPELEPYKNEDYPRAVILAPNKELCRQVVSAAQNVVGDLNKIVSIGNLASTSYNWPFHTKRPAPKILVCTPVMLASFNRNLALFANLKSLVLDEADMLLDGGYLKQLDLIMTALKRCERISQSAVDRYADSYEDEMWVPQRTQRILAAATLPTYGLKSIDAYVKKYFPGATYVSNNLMHKHHPRLHQSFLKVCANQEDKIEALVEILDREDVSRTMIFVNTASFAQEVYERLAEEGINCLPYHKETPLDQREVILNDFRSGKLPVLICTDMASRGLDIPNVSHVIQGEFATNVVQHLHRIGRAGRAGRAGKATALYDESSQDLVNSILAAGDNVLDKSFSRRRGFRKKIKKQYRKKKDERQYY